MRYPNSPQKYEKMLNFFSNQGNTNQTIMVYQCITTRMTKMKKTMPNVSNDVKQIELSIHC